MAVCQQRTTELSALVNHFILRRTNTLLSEHLPPKVTEVEAEGEQGGWGWESVCVALVSAGFACPPPHPRHSLFFPFLIFLLPSPLPTPFPCSRPHSPAGCGDRVLPPDPPPALPLPPFPRVQGCCRPVCHSKGGEGAVRHHLPAQAAQPPQTHLGGAKQVGQGESCSGARMALRCVASVCMSTGSWVEMHRAGTTGDVRCSGVAPAHHLADLQPTPHAPCTLLPPATHRARAAAKRPRASRAAPPSSQLEPLDRPVQVVAAAAWPPVRDQLGWLAVTSPHASHLACVCCKSCFRRPSSPSFALCHP